MTIVLLVFCLYGNTIDNGYNLDDEYVVLNGQVAQGISAIPKILQSRYVVSADQSYGYRPVAKITYAVEHTVFGQTPAISHLINVLLYLFTGVFLFYFLLTWFKHYSPWFLLIIVLLFLAHPLHTEVVASLKNREELLLFFSGITGFHFTLRYFQLRKLKFLFLSVLFLVVSILSKESGVVFLILSIAWAILFQLRLEKAIALPSVKTAGTLKIRSYPKYLFAALLALFAALIVIPMVYEIKSWIIFIHIPTFLVAAVLIPRWHWRKYKTFREITLKTKLCWSVLILALAFHFYKLGLLLYGALAGYLLLDYLYAFLINNALYLKGIAASYLKIAGVLLLILAVSALVFSLGYLLPQGFLEEEKALLSKQQNPLFELDSFYTSVLFGLKTIWEYLQLLVFPHPLLFYYGYNTVPVPTRPEPEVVFSALVHAGMMVLMFLSLKRSKLIFFGCLIYLLNVIFFSNIFFPVTGIIGERLVYTASLGFVILLAFGMFRLFNVSVKSRSVKPLKSKALLSLLAVIVILYGYKTIDRNNDWQSRSRLFENDIQYLENSARANAIYADQVFNRALTGFKKHGLNEQVKAQFEKAARHYELALSIDSTFSASWNNLATIHYNYLNNANRAKKAFRKCIQIDPGHYYAIHNLATIYENEGEFGRAKKLYKKVLTLKPEYLEGLQNLGNTYFSQHQYDSAFHYYSRVLEINPRIAEIHQKLAQMMIEQADTANALNFYQNILKIDPDRTDIQLKIDQLKNKYSNEK